LNDKPYLKGRGQGHVINSYHATLCQRGICCGSVSVCLSVCPSATSRYFIRKAKHIMPTTPLQ